MPTVFTVITRDVDGASRRKYRTRAAALKRFEEMLGYSVEAAISEAFYDREPALRPTRDTVVNLRGVSMYGTGVSFVASEA